MKQTIEIEVPEGFKAKYNPNESKIEFIKKDTKPKTWEEYAENTESKGMYYINGAGEIRLDLGSESSKLKKTLITSKEEAEAFIALMQLRQLRKAWVGDWKPNYKDSFIYPYQIHNGSLIICSEFGDFDIDRSCYSRPLSFPSREMAEEFFICFKDLIKKAKPLI